MRSREWLAVAERTELFSAMNFYSQTGTLAFQAVLAAAPGEVPEVNTGNESTLATVYNFPNPFRPAREATAVRYYLAQSGAVTIRVFDLKGDLIKTLLDNVPRPAGENVGDVWDGADARGARVSPGLYYLEIQAQGQKAIVRAAVVP